MASVVVDGGPTANGGSVNTLFTSVTICVPGSTTECQTIDHVQVDTASYGLRLLGPVLTLSLPGVKAADGNSLAECTQFVDGYSWGPVALADLQVSGETAASVPIQVIGAANFAAVPNACSSSGTTAEDTVATFGANGILGIGVFEQDCGSGCANNVNNGYYYSCPQTGSCAGAAPSLAIQVLNPVPLFAVDNNGTIIDLPSVASPGEATLTGSLIFGIDTQTNNKSGTQSVLTVDPATGNLTIVFNGQTLSGSFIDSGTNGIFFNDSNLSVCTDSNFSGFYCPASTQSFTASLTGSNAVSATATFTIQNAQTVVTANPTFAVLPTLGGTYSSSTNTFDWGLPFYYGRRVATAIDAHTTAVNTGPYIAF
ncbi:MAG: hypothetical protein QOD56_2088 [Gammaproteobacteria bacterium]|nr:hypothetical protein [Gammaproteobacteria bacterium]